MAYKIFLQAISVIGGLSGYTDLAPFRQFLIIYKAMMNIVYKASNQGNIRSLLQSLAVNHRVLWLLFFNELSFLAGLGICYIFCSGMRRRLSLAGVSVLHC